MNVVLLVMAAPKTHLLLDFYTDDERVVLYKWLDSTAIGRGWPAPIGWYQIHQETAHDVLLALAKEYSCTLPCRIRDNNGTIQALKGRTWVPLGAATIIYRRVDALVRR